MWFGHALVLAMVLCGSATRFVQAETLGIIYPETPRPFSRVFEALISGIEHGAAAHDVHRLELQEDDTTRRIASWLVAQQPDRVITLGRRAYAAYKALPGTPPSPIVGALDATPDTHPDVSGVSLSVDPALLFELLTSLRPSVRRVLVVMDPARDTTLSKDAKRAAAAHGLALEVYAASTLADSTAHFTNIFNYANPSTDALWLTLDGRLVDPNVNLATIVSQSWAKRFTVFSNNLEHVNRGVLFSLYPDPYALGQRLARLVLDGRRQGLEPLRDVKRAFNVRVAQHLGVPLTGTVRRRFDLILGERP